MKKMHDNYNRIAGELLLYIKKLVDLSVGKKIIIWGIDGGGRFIKNLIENYDERRKIYCFIDDKLSIYPAVCPVFRSSILNYIDSEECIILSMLTNINDIDKELCRYGYAIGYNVFDIRKEVGGSYLEYLEKVIPGIDFSSVYGNHGDCQEYTSFKHAGIDMVMETLHDLQPNIAFFDYGVGKGSAILVAYMHGIKILGGVEINENIYLHAKKNMEILNIPCNLILGDARTCNIDEYNCFFFYNPFRGELFREVIDEIEKSYYRKKRKIYLVYGNPFEHQQVIAHGVFYLFKHILVDLYDPILNIYTVND